MQDLEQCIQDYSEALYRFCCNQSKNRYEAEELYQETFLCVLENQKKFQKVKNPKCYILGIALNLERNRRRKIMRRRRIAPTVSGNYQTENGEQIDILTIAATSDSDTEDRAIYHEIQKKLQDEIQAMEETYRMILSLYYGNELSVKEVARVMKLTPGTVKNRLYQARKRLKERMEMEGYDGTEIR